MTRVALRLLVAAALQLVLVLALVLTLGSTHVVVDAGRRRNNGGGPSRSQASPSSSHKSAVNDDWEATVDRAQLHSLDALPATPIFLDAVARAHDIARGAMMGIQVEREAYINHRDSYRELLMRFADEPPSPLRVLKETTTMADVTSRAFAYYHAWRYIARSLEAILDHGRPTSAVYELFEHLYMSINEIGHETRYRYLPDLQRSVTSMRIRERQAQRWAGMLGAREAALQSASSPLLAEMARFNERMLRHMTTSAQCFDTIDWLDVDAIPDRVREYARAMRHSVEVELTSVYGVQRLVEDDFLDILRVYAVLAPLFADNTVFLEELRVRFTRKPVQLDRRPLATRRGSTGGQWQGKLSMISRIEYAGSQLASEFMQVLAIQSWRKGTRDYPQHAITNDAASYENAAQFEEMVADTHVLMAHMLRTMDRAVREVLPEYVEIVERRRACLKSVCEEDVASTSDSEEPDDTESEVQDQPAKLEEVESTSAVDEDVTTALDSLALDETPQKSPAVPSVPPRHHVCHELKTATAFRYNDPHFFNPRLKTDTSTTIPVPTIIDRSAMLTLCQLRGTLKGGENLSWTAIVKLITATLHGTVELKGGSRTTFFVPTPRAYAIAVDRPHPSNRIGHKIYQVRDVLFKKFGIEIEEFVAVGVKSG